jgi:hypothetical protein
MQERRPAKKRRFIAPPKKEKKGCAHRLAKKPEYTQKDLFCQ